MENRSQKLLKSLKLYYEDEQKLSIFTNIVNKQESDNDVSLRLIDWLVTNYSKDKRIKYTLDNKEQHEFVIHESYKNMLKAYSKRMFDPFRRHDRVYIRCNLLPSKFLETTVAQLSFFKWAIDNKVIDYAMAHKREIKEHMDTHTKHRNNAEKTKRKELTKYNKGAKLYNLNIRVTFT